MSPASKTEWATIAQCMTKIEHLEEAIKELKQELRNQRKERAETQRHISDRRLAIYLAIAAILGGFVVEASKLLITYLKP